MKTKALTVFFVTIVILSLCLIVFALTIDADAAEIVDVCPQPLRPQVWLPLVGQAHIAGMIDCIQHPYKCLGK